MGLDAYVLGALMGSFMYFGVFAVLGAWFPGTDEEPAGGESRG